MRRVDMAAQHRNGNAQRRRRKRATRSGRRSWKIDKDLLGCGGHVDAGQLESLALCRALYGYMMAGMRRHLILRIHNVDLLVGVVYEHVLGAMFLNALDRALVLSFFRALYSPPPLRTPAGP